MEKLLSQLVEKLQEAYGDRLISVVLYGSAACGDHQPKFSDINVLCVFADMARRDLAAGEDVIRWWQHRGDAAPILMTEREISDSAECFAIEFIEMQRGHRVLFGKDVISGLVIERRFYRAQVERDLRAKLLRLRQKAAGTISHPDLLRRLLLDSVATFCVLFRHALLLRGIDAPRKKRETMEMAREHFQIDTAPFEKLLDVREGRVQARQADPIALLGPFLDGVSGVIERMER